MAFVHLFFLFFLILQRISCTFCVQEVHLVFRFQTVFHESHFAVPEFRVSVFQSFNFFRTVVLSFFQLRGVLLQVNLAVRSSCLKVSIFKVSVNSSLVNKFF